MLLDGKQETFKERLEFDDETKTIKCVGVEGDVFKLYKSCTSIFEVTPKGDGCLVKIIIDYEKLSEDVPAPENYVAMLADVAKDICSHHSKT